MEWISVKDKMPQPFKIVLVAGGIAFYTGLKWNTVTCCEWPGQTIKWEVKYWMPFPECPL